MSSLTLLAGISGAWVELLHEVMILKRVLLPAVSLWSIELWLHNLLDLLTVDDAGNVSVLHLGTRKVVTLLGWSTALHGAVDLVQLFEGTLSEDDKASKVAARSQA